MNWDYKNYKPSRRLRIIQAILLTLIVIGIGLLLTQKMWVPKLVELILQNDPTYNSPLEPDLVVPPVVASPSPKPTPTPTPTPAPKPTPTPVTEVKSGVQGHVTIGPTCPVVREPADPNCADKPYKTTLVLSSTIIGRNGGVLIQTDEKGMFTDLLPPGTYMIRSQSSSMLPRLEPVTFEVVANRFTQLNLQFDSGIR